MKYYTFYYNPKIGFKQILKTTWTNHPVDFQRKEEGRMYTNEMDAIGAANRWIELYGDSVV